MSKASSYGTGFFLECYASGWLPGHLAFLEVRVGPSGCFFTRCPLCGVKVFLTEESGWRGHARSKEGVEKIRDAQRAIPGAAPTHIICAPPPPPAPEVPASPEDVPPPKPPKRKKPS